MDSLQPGETYHIYNHANGEDDLFKEDANYLYFLKRYAHFIYPIAETYAYCLMPNHFHLLINIRREEDLIKNLMLQTFPKNLNLEGFQNPPGLDRKIIQQFSNLFNSYTKAYNKMYERKGSLFIKNFKRKHIADESCFTSIVQYIHSNPVHHGFCDSIKEWYWSSYHTYLNNKHTLLRKQETLKWFGGREEFIKKHKEIPALLPQPAFIF